MAERITDSQLVNSVDSIGVAISKKDSFPQLALLSKQEDRDEDPKERSARAHRQGQVPGQRLGRTRPAKQTQAEPQENEQGQLDPTRGDSRSEQSDTQPTDDPAAGKGEVEARIARTSRTQAVKLTMGHAAGSEKARGIDSDLQAVANGRLSVVQNHENQCGETKRHLHGCSSDPGPSAKGKHVRGKKQGEEECP